MTTVTTPAPRTRRRRLLDGRTLGVVRWLAPVALLLLWQLGSALGWISERALPAPSLVLQAGWETIRSGELLSALEISGLRVAEGLVLGGLAGILLGVLVGSSRIADATIDPNLQILRALPHLGMIPLFIIWFGIYELPKVLMVALGAMFPLYLNTVSALRQVNTRLLETATVLGFSRWQRFVRVILPSSAPQILVGLRQSLAIAWITLIVCEQINATSGIGYMINNARDFYRLDVIIFCLVVYGALGMVTDAIVRVLERRALAYRN